MAITSNCFWAAAHDKPARDLFVIENGEDEFWRRVRQEIDKDVAMAPPESAISER